MADELEQFDESTRPTRRKILTTASAAGLGLAVGALGSALVPDAVWEVATSQRARSHVPGLQRLATTEEIAAFALALCSPEHAYLTRASLVIDGGKAAHAG